MSNNQNDLSVLAELAATIEQRANDSQNTSYTARLLAKGTEKCAKKFGEEAVELALAAMTDDKKHITSEAGDVLYHLLVLLKVKNVSLSAVMDELHSRTSQSGLEEKAARKPSASEE